MKKQLLILGLCAMALGINAQTNVLGSGDFTTPFDATKTFESMPSTSYWFSLIKGAAKTGGSTITPDTDTDASYGNVVKLYSGTTVSWYQAFLGKRTKIEAGINKDVYTLSFDVKSVGNKFKTRVYITDPVTKDIFIKLNDVDVNSTDPDITKLSAASYTYTSKALDTWEHVSVDYDFKNVVNNINSISSTGDKLSMTPITDATLKDFVVAVLSDSKNSTVLVDNISLIKKSEIPPTSIANSNKDANGLIIYTNGNNVNVLNAKSAIEIYDISGKLIQKENSENFSIAQKGIYILKTNNATQKLVIR